MEGKEIRKNRLFGASSPYLRQHGTNPVDWYAWGEEPFEKARERQQPVLVSIGYAACHWCHVMESESFEDAALAEWMNAHFVCIKVDREEHPDVDQFYMEAAQALTGSGGWPLNVFVDADRRPFFAGTYFPPEPLRSMPSWRQVLEWVLDLWTNRKQEVELQANQLTQVIQGAQESGGPTESSTAPGPWAQAMGEQIMRSADREYGGWGTAPKFPSAMAIRLLIESSWFQSREEFGKQAIHTLDQMRRGGIYDQLAGGFCRYSTDSHWTLPHFEKMLYDNAQLVEAYSLAYQWEPRKEWERVIRETIEFVERELRDAQGGYDSALDADSEGEEGKYYTWTREEFREMLPEAPPWMEAYLLGEGGLPHQERLPIRRPHDPAAFAREQGLGEEDMEEQVARALEQLKKRRDSRIRPQRADQRILSWNALWNLALTRAATALDHEPFFDRAEAHMDWMLAAFRPGPGQWKRIVGREGAAIEANLGDLAALISALLALASWRKKDEYLEEASALIEDIIRDFSDDQGRFFLLVQKAHQRVPLSRIEKEDLTLPSSNALMAHNLVLASMIFGRSSYGDRAQSMLESMRSLAQRYPISYAYWALLIQRQDKGWRKLQVSGKKAGEVHRRLSRRFWPQVYGEGVDGEEKEGGQQRLAIQVCRSLDCLPAVSSEEEAISLIEDNQ